MWEKITNPNGNAVENRSIPGPLRSVLMESPATADEVSRYEKTLDRIKASSEYKAGKIRSLPGFIDWILWTRYVEYRARVERGDVL